MNGLTGVLEVMRWEVLRHLRNRSFLLGMLATPLIGILAAGIPTLLAHFERPEVRVYAMVDRIGAYPALEALISDGPSFETLIGTGEVRLMLVPDEATASARVEEGVVDGYLVLDEAFDRTGIARLYMADENRRIPGGLEAALTQLLQNRRLAALGLDAEAAEHLRAPATVEVNALGPDPAGLSPAPGQLATAIGTLALLMILILTSGTMLLQSALQEKRDRMSEVVLSSINANQLMAGKIAGHFSLGVVQVAVWSAVGLPLAVYVFRIAVGDWIAVDHIPIFILFFFLGYLLYAALFVAAGATMEDIQSASNVQGLVFMLPFLSLMLIGPVINNPGGPIARFGSLFPLTTPFITVLRMGFATVPAWEVASAAAILLASTAVITLLAARIFRVGMLMYGKSPSPAEIWRWLRTP